MLYMLHSMYRSIVYIYPSIPASTHTHTKLFVTYHSPICKLIHVNADGTWYYGTLVYHIYTPYVTKNHQRPIICL